MKPFRVFVGWDEKDATAYDKCEASLLYHASVPVEVIPLQHWKLRNRGLYWRSFWTDGKGQKWDDRDGKPHSTDFSFTRFCVPALEGFSDEWVLFMDADMLWQADIKELIDLIDHSKSVMCVQHQHIPPEAEKMGGLKQTRYERKNWSSLMLMKPSGCRDLTPYNVNNQTGSWLHAMVWVPDEKIGSIPEEWNWLEGWSSEKIKPKIIHYTRGTPDMPGCENVAYAKEWWEA